MKIKRLPHFFTAREIADMFQQPAALIDRMIRTGIHPPFIWRPRWAAPRWSEDSFPAWNKILRDVDLSTLPEDPPPLTRPEKVFEGSRPRGATRQQLDQFLRLFPKREQERLRALAD